MCNRAIGNRRGVLLLLLTLIPVACQSLGQGQPSETIAPSQSVPVTTHEANQEQELSFETIAKSDDHDLGTEYQGKEPTLLVIARAEEIDDPSQAWLAEDIRLVEQLRTLDYDHVFAVLVLHGLVNRSGPTVTVRKITRQGDQVTVWAEFAIPTPGGRAFNITVSPYHLVAVPKSGFRGEQVHFFLMNNDLPVAESTHFIP